MWSWLGSPAVALLGLLSSVITIVQVTIGVTIFLKRKMPRTAEERRRLSIWISLVALGSVIAVTAVTWSAVLAEAAKIGDHGVMGVLFALMLPSLGMAGALLLLIDGIGGRRFSLLALCCFFGSMAVPISIDLNAHNVGWSVYLEIVGLSVMGCTALTWPLTYKEPQTKDSVMKARTGDHMPAEDPSLERQ